MFNEQNQEHVDKWSKRCGDDLSKGKFNNYDLMALALVKASNSEHPLEMIRHVVRIYSMLYKEDFVKYLKDNFQL